METVRTRQDEYSPPPWLNVHPALRERDIYVDTPIKPGVIFATNHVVRPGAQWAVKILRDHNAQEADFYDKLNKLDPASPNHTIPCIVVRSPATCDFLIMPYLSLVTVLFTNLPTLLGYYDQILQGIGFLHNLNIAHMDFASGNCVVAEQKDMRGHTCIKLDKVYVIDFGCSRQFELGPGLQPAVELGPAQHRPPPSIKVLDPYSWDMYCVGRTFEGMAEELYWNTKPPWLLRRYVSWLLGRERGCAGVCHCRPRVRRARQVLCVLRILAWVWCGPRIAFLAVRRRLSSPESLDASTLSG